MHDPQYRVSVAWQNVAYNQPPHVSYYLPDMVKKLTKPDIYMVGEEQTSNEEDNPSSVAINNAFGGNLRYNPSTGALYVSKSGYVQVEFFNLNGSLVGGSSKNALAGASVFFAGQESLPKGLYVMKAKYDGKVVQRAFFRN